MTHLKLVYPHILPVIVTHEWYFKAQTLPEYIYAFDPDDGQANGLPQDRIYVTLCSEHSAPRLREAWYKINPAFRQLHDLHVGGWWFLLKVYIKKRGDDYILAEVYRPHIKVKSGRRECSTNPTAENGLTIVSPRELLEPLKGSYNG